MYLSPATPAKKAHETANHHHPFIPSYPIPILTLRHSLHPPHQPLIPPTPSLESKDRSQKQQKPSLQVGKRSKRTPYESRAKTFSFLPLPFSFCSGSLGSPILHPSSSFSPFPSCLAFVIPLLRPKTRVAISKIFPSLLCMIGNATEEKGPKQSRKPKPIATRIFTIIKKARKKREPMTPCPHFPPNSLSPPKPSTQGQ